MRKRFRRAARLTGYLAGCKLAPTNQFGVSAMRKILGFVALAITATPALADVLPPQPPGRGIGLAAVVVVVLAVAGLGAMRWKQER